MRLRARLALEAFLLLRFFLDYFRDLVDSLQDTQEPDEHHHQEHGHYNNRDCCHAEENIHLEKVIHPSVYGIPPVVKRKGSCV